MTLEKVEGVSGLQALGQRPWGMQKRSRCFSEALSCGSQGLTRDCRLPLPDLRAHQMTFCYLTFTDFSVYTLLRMVCLMASHTNLSFSEGEYFLEDPDSKLFLGL